MVTVPLNDDKEKFDRVQWRYLMSALECLNFDLYFFSFFDYGLKYYINLR